ncbi:hypothetical protein BH24ACT5_BH24ACT5_14370 [soil metagenome]
MVSPDGGPPHPLVVGRVVHGTTAEGPFRRSAVWTQGCSIRCAGCINPHLFGTAGGETVDPVALAGEIVAADVEGVTLLGGEPFDQADACADVAEAVGAAGLGVITSTGHAHESLVGRDVGAFRLLAATDLLVDGPYRRGDAETTRSLVGSTNQRFIHLTRRYRSFEPGRHRNRVDVRIEPSGVVRVAGFLTRPARPVVDGTGEADLRLFGARFRATYGARSCRERAPLGSAGWRSDSGNSCRPRRWCWRRWRG